MSDAAWSGYSGGTGRAVPEVVESLVSTIIPVYNRREMVVEATESVLAQTYRPIEIIISDDGSTDETPEAAQSLVEKHPNAIRYVRNENRGPGPAREAGRVLARGEFIEYLDSDDLLLPRKFEVQVQALREHPECGVAYGRSRLVDLAGKVLADPFKWTGRRIRTLFPGLLVDRWWCTHTPLYRRSLCDQIGPWSDLRWSQDWEYDGRVGALGTQLAYCDEPVSEHRQHEAMRQTSKANWLEPFRAKERQRFLGLLFRHAKRAGLTHEAPEMQHFSRWAFMVARWCGAAGLAEDSAECFGWARESAGAERSRGKDFRLYAALAGVLGWRIAGRLACWIERRRSAGPGPETMKQSWMTE